MLTSASLRRMIEASTMGDARAMMFRRREDTPEAAARRLRFAVIAALNVGYVEADMVRLVRRTLNDAKMLEKL